MRRSIQYIQKNLKGPLVGCEVGVQRGINAKDMLLLDIKRLYLVDPYPAMATPKIEAYFDEAYGYTRPFFRKVTWLIMTSQEAARILNDTLDFVYIDGKHDYDNVKLDISLWYSKIRKGGVLCGHDYRLDDHGWQRVTKAVHEFLDVHQELKLNYAYDPAVRWETDWWIVKK